LGPIAAAMQQQYLEEVARTFPGQVRARVPLFSEEVRGLPMLRQMAAALFAES